MLIETNEIMKKYILILGILLTTNLFSTEKSCKKVSPCCEKTEDIFSFAYPIDENLICPRNMTLHAKYLLFKSYEKDREYILSTEYIDKVEKDRRWNHGFRISYDFLMSKFEYYFEAAWTYLKLKHKSSIQIQNNTLLGIFLPPQSANVMNSASDKISCDFNTLDLMITNPHNISKYYISNPKIGVRASFIDQDFLIRYFINNVKSIVELKNDQWGFGPRASYESKFILSRNFKIGTKIAGSILFSKFDISQKSQINSSLPVTLTYQSEDSFYSSLSNIELGMAIFFSRYFNKKTNLFSLDLGYELHRWRHLGIIRKFFDTDPTASSISKSGNLGFNGFTFGLKIDF